MHSALKHEGKRLYEFARRGEDVERPPRQIEIHRIQRVSWGADHIEFDVRCSKGTYIRTLAADIAIRLGTLAFVEGLRRLAVDPFDGLPMFTLDELTSLQMLERDLRLHPPDAAFSDLPALVLDDVQERALLQGRSLLGPEPAGTAGQLRVYGADQRFLGLVDVQIDGRLQPSRLFVDTGPSKA
jgi:tRNA pseudouridine55 synthase